MPTFLFMRAVPNTLRIAALGLIATLPATAKAEEGCTLANDFCVPFVGCSDDGAIYFSGRGYGRGAGPVVARRSDGVLCQGSWELLPNGVGVAQMTCDDGMRAEGRYTWVDSASGTVTGSGITDRGHNLVFWSGKLIADYIRRDGTLDPSLLTCASEALDAPMS